jgi:autotransporter-associated beta strand protein
VVNLVYSNGSLAATPFTDNNPPGYAGMNLATVRSTDNDWGANIQIGEVVGIYGALSDTQRAALDAYLNYKWAGGTEAPFPTYAQEASGALPAASVVNMSDNTVLDINDNIATIGGLSGPDTAQVLLGPGTAGSAVLTVGGNASSEFAGTITGSGVLVKAGDGSLTLSGSNDYTQGTVVHGGTLQIGSPTALPAGGSLTIGEGDAVGLSGGLVAAAAGQAVPDSCPAAPVPEPGTLALLAATALFAVGGWLRGKGFGIS